MNLYEGDDAMTTTNADGRARKSLAEQIDRLDAILDGLSEALQGVLAEVLTNPTLQDKLRGPAGPPPAADPPVATPRSRLKERLSGLRRRARSLGGWAGSCLASVWQRAQVARWLVVGPLALGAGVLAGVVASLAGRPVAPAAAGLAGVAGAVLARVRSLARQTPVVPAMGGWAAGPTGMG
jgi:hypothetical protein